MNGKIKVIYRPYPIKTTEGKPPYKKCLRCGALLKTKVSQKRGYGSVCFSHNSMVILQIEPSVEE